MKYSNITVGSDPELFFIQLETGKIISAIGKVGGSKEKPLAISNNGHALQEDNVTCEFNIPPCRTSEEFVENINFVKDYIQRTVCEPLGLYATILPSAYLEEDQLDHPNARRSGCDPDFNVYTMDVNISPGMDSNLRSCGGHIAVGYDNPNVEDSVALIKAMDLFLGVPSILLDKDTERRKLYGKAGCFRFKEFGVEFRTLSNFWILNDELISWAFNQTLAAIEFLNNGGEITEEQSKEIVDCINNQDTALADKIIKQNNLICVEL